MKVSMKRKQCDENRKSIWGTYLPLCVNARCTSVL